MGLCVVTQTRSMVLDIEKAIRQYIDFGLSDKFLQIRSFRLLKNIPQLLWLMPFEEFSEGMGGIACGDEIVDKYYLLFLMRVLYFLSKDTPFWPEPSSFFVRRDWCPAKRLFSERTHQGLLYKYGRSIQRGWAAWFALDNPVKRTNRGCTMISPVGLYSWLANKKSDSK